MDMKLDDRGASVLQQLQDTELSPMEEVLFKSWTRANQIDDPDAPDDTIDYRGIYKSLNGTVLPYGELKRSTDRVNKEQKLQNLLQQQMLDRIQETVGKEEDFGKQLHKEERQDVTHKQKMEMEGLKLKRAPHDLKMKDFDIKAKGMDLDKQRIGLDATKLQNEGKQIDLIASMMQPAAPMAPAGSQHAATKTGTTSGSSSSKRSRSTSNY